MTYSIVYDAIKIKTTRFEKPAPIINLNELVAAILISYRQAGMTPPKLDTGICAGELQKKFLEETAGKEGINPQLITAIKEYPHEKLVIDEMARETYAYGLEHEELT